VIEGAGPAGSTLACLLLERGADVRFYGKPPKPGRIVAISRETLKLAAELWRLGPEQLGNGVWLSRRQTAWASRTLEYGETAALSCDVGRLAQRLLGALAARGLELREDAAATDEDCDWMVRANGRLAVTDVCQGGLRVAQRGWMAHVPTGAGSSMAVAATANGWLFGCPHPDGGFAIIVFQPAPCDGGGAADAMQAAVDSVWPGSGAHVDSSEAPEPCAPLLARRPVEPSLLRVGDAALAVDALRGDGFGYAIRGALLAQAAMAAPNALGALRHYSGRLREVFRAHLRNCIVHYSAAWNAALWAGELARMMAASRSVGPTYVPEQHLHGLDLRPAARLSSDEHKEEIA